MSISGAFSGFEHDFNITMNDPGSVVRSAAVSAVPLPATGGLVLIGLAALGLVRRRAQA